MRPLDEQTILITGATDGLGRALATELAAAGATLLIHGRDDARGQQTIDDIASSTGNRRLPVVGPVRFRRHLVSSIVGSSSSGIHGVGPVRRR